MTLGESQSRILSLWYRQWSNHAIIVRDPSMKWILRMLVGFFAIVLVIVMSQRLFIMPEILNHHGDGRFENNSTRVGPFINPGYSVTFPAIDLSQKCIASYQFSSLPSIMYGYQCRLFFVIPSNGEAFAGPRPRIPALDAGRIVLVLTDAKRNEVVKMEGRLDEYTWCGYRHFFFLYQSGCSRFQPDPDEKYELSLIYEPSPSFQMLKGYAYIECGGKK